jgi:subtilase family serine protease
MHASRRAAIALAASIVTTGAVLATATTAHAAGGRTMLAGSKAPAATPGARVGTVADSQKLSVQVWLKPDIARATKFADAVSTPGTAEFHHYLSPKAYTAQFGPSTKQAGAVRSWLAGQGMSGVKVSGQRDYVTATGPVSTVEKAFAVQMNRYRVKDAKGKSTVIQSNDRDASIPASLSGDVLAVTGMNSSAPLAMHTAKSTKSAAAPTCSKYWAEHTTSFKPAFRGLTKASLPVCGYSASQLRAAYGATTKNNGAGQTVAMIEVGTPTAMFETLTDYAKQNKLPAPNTNRFRELVLGRGNDCGNAFDIEEQLDSESVYAMAPGASQLMVDGDSCDERLQGVQSLFDAELAPLTSNGNHPLASIESNSWGITGGESFPVVYANTAHSINLRATAEGVGMYFSSGDDPGVSVPASDPYSLSVGGTTVGIGANNNRVFETGWSNNDAELDGTSWFDDGIPRDAAGGGTSLLYAQPSYQKHVVPSSMSHVGAGSHAVNRAVPDISADADPNSGILQGVIEPDDHGNPGKYQTFVDGGTSLAAPLVAGIVADAQQGQKKAFGFVNPMIYSLYRTGALHDALPVTKSTPVQNRAAYTPAGTDNPALISVFDSQLPAYTDQVTASGYDTMTGVGTPNGSAFITALRHAAG